MAFRPVTSEEVSSQLSASFPVEAPAFERRLTDWRAKGYLPALSRLQRGVGQGSGARYGWEDDEVLAQAFTLLSLRELRGRMETAVTLTWFCGFEYPIERMRRLWVGFEELPWRAALRRGSPGEPVEDRDAVDMLVWRARRSRRGRKASTAFIDTLIRMDVDEHFDPASLSNAQAAQILNELASIKPQAAAVVGSIHPGQLKGFLHFVHDIWSAPRLMALVASLPEDELAAVHRDCRRVLGLYRAWLGAALDARRQGGEANEVALWMAPRLAWSAGRFLMRLDIVLRRAGLARHIEATLEFLARLAGDPETGELLHRCRRSAEEILAAPDEEARAAVTRAALRSLDASGDLGKLRARVDYVVEALSELWTPVFHAARDLAADLATT
jgi:hypothetical protein